VRGDDGQRAEGVHVETVAGWLAPSKTIRCEIVERFKPARSGVMSLEESVRKLSLRFLDVYGDEWEVSFRPRGSGSEAKRLTNASGYW
jgi:hypothetical protein